MYKRLETCVAKMEIDKKEIAEEAEMNYRTFIRKLTGKAKFTLNEAVAVHRCVEKYLRASISVEELFEEG